MSITLHELITDVIAHPEQYTDAFTFSVSGEPVDVDRAQWDQWMRNVLPGTATGQNMWWRMPWMPGPDSVAARILRGDSFRQPRYEERVLGEGRPTLNTPDDIDDDRQYIAPGLPTRPVEEVPQWRGMPWEEFVAMQRQYDEVNRQMQEFVARSTDYSQTTVPAGPTNRFHESDMPLPPRPDHYRVTGGQCACGFRSMFSGEMDHHIDGENGVAGLMARHNPLCGNCGTETGTHRVAIAVPTPVSYAEREFTSLPTPAVRDEHWCRRCLATRYNSYAQPPLRVPPGHTLTVDHPVPNGVPVTIDQNTELGTVELRDPHTGRTLARITNLDTTPEVPE